MTMKNKVFALLSLSILAVLVLMSCVSAASLSIGTVTGNESTISQESGKFTFTFELINSGVASDLNWSLSTLSAGDVSFSFSHNNIADGSVSPQTILVTVTGDFDDSYFGIISGKIIADPDSGNNAEVDYSINVTEVPRPDEIKDCISVGSTRNLELSIEDFSIQKGYGDEQEWFPLDEVEVEIEVENKGDEKIKDVVIGWGLYNSETKEWIIDEEESDFNLGDDEKKTIYINFKLDDPDDFEDDGTYIFYVWAEGEDNNEDPEEDTCVWNSEDIEIEIESDFVIIDNFKFSELVSCGSKNSLTAEVWNVGDSDQDEVSVGIYNKELGISELVSIGDLDAFDDFLLNFEFEIPQDAEEKTYFLEFKVYDEDGDLYENNYDDESSVSLLPLKVEGGCIVIPKVSVSATLESGGNAGEQMVLKSVITNTGETAKIYNINAKEYSSWASEVVSSVETFALDAGQSQEITFTFDVNKDASGTYLFDLEVYSDGELELKQPVQVSITKKAGFLTGSVINEDNWYLWGIGGLNVLLILIIIIVAIKVAKN
jgi:hypothetical protein